MYYPIGWTNNTQSKEKNMKRKGLIIVGISLKLLDLKDIRLANFLPALVIAPLIVVAVPLVKAFF